MSEAKTAPSIEPITISLETARKLSGLSERTLYRMLAAKALTARRSGSRTLIDWEPLKAHLKNLPEYVSGRTLIQMAPVRKTRKPPAAALTVEETRQEKKKQVQRVRASRRLGRAKTASGAPR